MKRWWSVLAVLNVLAAGAGLAIGDYGMAAMNMAATALCVVMGERR